MNDENLEKGKFKPGQSGNPNGRPKGVKNWDVVMRELFEKGDYSQEDIVKIYIEQAKEGNIKAMEWLADRMDGKANEKVKHEVDEIIVRLVRASETLNDRLSNK